MTTQAGESMWGWCSVALNRLHARKAIGYEKRHSGYMGREVTYFVVWVCEACSKTWWVQDRPETIRQRPNIPASLDRKPLSLRRLFGLR